MSVTIPKNSRGPILNLTLPASTPALSIVVTNVTTLKSLQLNLPASWAGKDLVLDFFRQTIRDEDGTDRSSLLDATNNLLWTTAPLITGANDVKITVNGGPIIAQDGFNQSAGILDIKVPDVGSGYWVDGGPSPRLTVDATFHVVTRTQSSGDANLQSGAHAQPSTSLVGHVFAEVASWIPSAANSNNYRQGLIVRGATLMTNLLMMVREYNAVGSQFRVLKSTTGGGANVQIGTTKTLPFALSVPLVMGIEVDAAGKWTTWVRAVGQSYGAAMDSGTDSDLAAAGALGSGQVGIYSSQTNTTGIPILDDFKAVDLSPAAYGATARLSWIVGHYA